MSALGDTTEAQWAELLLDHNTLPVTSPNLTAIVSWEIQESGDPANAGGNNPLNTTEDWPGATDFNSFGPNGEYHVKNYASINDGILATSAGLYNGRYATIIAALEAGDDAQRVIDAVMESPWGTKNIHLVEPVPVPGPAPEPCDAECWAGVERIVVWEKALAAKALAVGDRGPEVLDLNAWLIVNGAEPNVAGDAYGARTKFYVAEFKAKYNLPNRDGAVAGGTIAAALVAHAS